jgi:hypothetical protein
LAAGVESTGIVGSIGMGAGGSASMASVILAEPARYQYTGGGTGRSVRKWSFNPLSHQVNDNVGLDHVNRKRRDGQAIVDSV